LLKVNGFSRADMLVDCQFLMPKLFAEKSGERGLERTLVGAKARISPPARVDFPPGDWL